MASLTLRSSSPNGVASNRTTISWLPLASGPKPTRWMTTDFLSGKSSALDFEIAAARSRSSSPRSISMPECGTSTPSIEMRAMRVTEASLSRFFSVKRTPSAVFARLPKV